MKSKRIKFELYSIYLIFIAISYFSIQINAQIPIIEYKIKHANDTSGKKLSTYKIELLNDSAIRLSEVFNISPNKTQLINEALLIYNKHEKEYIYIRGTDTCINKNYSKVFNTKSQNDSLKYLFNISFERINFQNRRVICLCNSRKSNRSQYLIHLKEFNPFFILYMESKSFQSHAQPVIFELVKADPKVYSKLQNFKPIIGIRFTIIEKLYFNPQF